MNKKTILTKYLKSYIDNYDGAIDSNQPSFADEDALSGFLDENEVKIEDTEFHAIVDFLEKVQEEAEKAQISSGTSFFDELEKVFNQAI